MKESPRRLPENRKMAKKQKRFLNWKKKVFFFCSFFIPVSESTHRVIGPNGLSVVGTNSEISNLGNEIQSHVFPNGERALPSGVGEMKGVVQIFGQTPLFSHISGQLTFHQLPGQGPVIISGNIKGLPRPGLFGMHFHERPSPGPGFCQTVGEHYNPFHMQHGDKDDAQRHLGDLGNIVAGPTGRSHVVKNDWFISLNPKLPNSVVGKPVVIHIRPDDLGKRPLSRESRKSGNSGTKIACGNLRLI